MKKILFAFFALASVALTFSACSDDDNEEKAYPSHLNGIWEYVNASSGYTGYLMIEDLDGGQFAYFSLVSPDEKDKLLLNNSFKYDSNTGIGTIEGKLFGGITVTIKANKGSDKTLNIKVSQIVEGGSQQDFTGEFTYCENKEKYAYPTHLNGIWTYNDSSTGYTGTLKIEDLYGGQYAYFSVITPEKEEAYALDNTFKYDPLTGIGTIERKLLGGISVTIQTTKGSDKNLDVKVIQVVEGGTQTKLSGKFTLE